MQLEASYWCKGRDLQLVAAPSAVHLSVCLIVFFHVNTDMIIASVA